MSYFEDQINSNQPIVPPTAEQAPPFQSPTAQTPTVGESFKGLTVRANGDRVFLIKDGKKAWITSPEAMEKLGFKLGDEVKMDQISLDLFPDTDPIR